MAIKVLFLIQGFEVASSRYRVLQYIPYLEKKDILATVVPFPKTILDKINIYPKISKFDILFLHRKRLPFFEHLYVRRKAKKIIYDFDDAVMVRNSTRENPYSITRFRRFVRTVKDSDYIFAGNRFLMEQAKKYNPNVMVLPTSIDLNNYPLKNWKIRSDNIIIGWIGDTGSLHYLEKLAPVFEKLAYFDKNIRLKIVCSHFFDLKEMKVIKSLWSSETEIKDLLSFDIGIMPLVEDIWSEGKCGFKIIQYMGVGLPVVCSPIGVNKELVKEGVNGFFAKDEQQWIDKIMILAKDIDLRAKMGKEGRKRIEENYSVQANEPKFYQILKDLINGQKNKI
ncbi:MAG: glycosyltransferase family 4 protein [Deltaproteobacteria bacterium]|nr:glycosyltransferase family 4 protein [Deltaproteobacteria bacterium]